jgi:hypothetical protein
LLVSSIVSYLHYMCLFTYSDIQYIGVVIFVLFGGTNITHHFVISINQPCFVTTFLSNTFITCWCFYLFICIFIILFFLFLSLYIFIFALWYINVRGYRRGNQNSAIQRNWQHRVRKTQTNNTKITTPMYWISHNKMVCDVGSPS